MPIYEIKVRIDADTPAQAQVRCASIDAALQPMGGVWREGTLRDVSPPNKVDKMAQAEDEAWAEWEQRIKAAANLHGREWFGA